MTKFTTVHNTELKSTNGLGSISRTYSGIAFGSLIDDCAFLIDPDPRYVDGNESVRNRGKPNAQVGRTGQSAWHIHLGEFDNAAPAFDLQGPMVLGEPVTKGSLNPNEWSVFTVVDGLGMGTVARDYVTLCRTEMEDVVAPQLALISTSGTGQNEIIMYENTMREADQPRRVDYQTNLETTGPNLVQWNFSTRNGCSIYFNGQKVAENVDDKRPLDFGYTADELAMFLGMRGKIGITGGFNIDFSDAKNSGARRAIEAYCAWYYDIAALKDIHPERPSYFDLDL